METRNIGIVMNGVTGRMGTNQHLIRSILAIIKQGGIKVNDDLVLMPAPILTGRNANKLKPLAETVAVREIGRPLPYTTDLQKAIDDPKNEIFFDASGTLQRAAFVEMAVKAKKAVYCEKPTAVTTKDALALYDLCKKAGVKNGVVQDKLWLPGIRKLKQLIDSGFFGRILSVRGEFGYWVFSGHVKDQPIQRPSWNYREEDGGGIMIDMFCHWRYVLDNVFGPVKSVVSWANVDLPERIDESGKPYKATADDSAYAMFLLDDGKGGNVMAQFNSSWCVRVRRDDLLTIQVDGTKGSAVAGLRECWIQSEANTPKPVWNPDIPQPIDFYKDWSQMPAATTYDNAFKIQWELFLRHVALNEPFPWDLREGAKGVQLAELGLQSWKDQAWKSVPAL
jgi:predicted dehydrogenase